MGREPSVTSLLTMASPSQSPAERLAAKKKSRNYCVKAPREAAALLGSSPACCWHLTGFFSYCQRILKQLLNSGRC